MADGVRRQRRGTTPRKDPLAPVREASRRVGVTAFARATWLVAFARRWRDTPPDAVVPTLQWEVLVFAKAPGTDRTSGSFSLSGKDLPDWQVVNRLQRLAWIWLCDLRDKGRVEIAAGSWTGTLWTVRGEVEPGTVVPRNWEDAFALRIHAALGGLRPERAHLRFCVHCRNAFVSRRADSATCSGACRTQAWRKSLENRKKLREYRKKAYAKAHPKNTIPPQRSHAKDGD